MSTTKPENVQQPHRVEGKADTKPLIQRALQFLTQGLPKKSVPKTVDQQVLSKSQIGSDELTKIAETLRYLFDLEAQNTALPGQGESSKKLAILNSSPEGRKATLLVSGNFRELASVVKEVNNPDTLEILLTNPNFQKLPTNQESVSQFSELLSVLSDFGFHKPKLNQKITEFTQQLADQISNTPLSDQLPLVIAFAVIKPKNDCLAALKQSSTDKLATFVDKYNHFDSLRFLEQDLNQQDQDDVNIQQLRNDRLFLKKLANMDGVDKTLLTKINGAINAIDLKAGKSGLIF